MSISVNTHIVQTAESLSLFTCRATVTVTEKAGSVNVANNTSVVTISFSVKMTSNRNFTGTSRPKAGYLYITVNGVEEWWTIPFPNGSALGTVLRSESYEQTITHSDDGSKSVSYSCYMGRGTDERNYDVVWENSGTDSSSLKLTTIPRASKATVTPGSLVLSHETNTLTVNTNRAASGFTHTVKATVGSFSETKTGVGASTTFSIPKFLITEMTGTSMNGTVEVTTYNGNSQIGSKTTTSFKVEVDTSQEHAELISWTLTDTNSATNPYTNDSFIYDASDLQATLNIGVAGTNTLLAKAKVSIDDVSQTYTLSGTAAQISFTKNKVKANKLKVELTDARGYVKTVNVPLTIIPYEPIKISQVTITRVNGNGNPSDTGSYLSFTIKGTGFCGSFGAAVNSANWAYQYKLPESTAYSAGTITGNVILSGTGQAQSFTVTGMTGEEFPSASEMDIHFTLNDLFSEAVSGVVRVHEGLPVYGWGREHFDVYGTLHVHSRQDASNYISIDHLGGGLSGILQTQWFTSASVSCAANTAGSVSIPITVPSGYKYVAVLHTCSNGNIIPSYCTTGALPSAGNVSVWWRNPTGSAMTATFSVNVLFIRE